MWRLYHHLLLLLLSAASSASSAASAASTINLGSFITPSSSSWLSQDSSSFELRFYAASSGGSSGFSVGILFRITGMPLTVAWSAGDTIIVSASASFNLSSSGDLLLLPSAASPPSAALWRSATAGAGVAQANLQNDGNLVLVNASGYPLWQSFLAPSDTLLQNQSLYAGSSALKSGAYRATMSAAGNLTLFYISAASSLTVDYWSSNTAAAATGGAYAELRQTIDSVALAVYNASGGAIAIWYPADYTPLSNDDQIYRRVKLDDDGNLRIYSWSAGDLDWSVGWQAVEDQCLVYGYCGPNGICKYAGGAATATAAACSCAAEAGFAFVDPSTPRLGCKALSDDGGLSCNSSATAMVALNHTQLFLPSSLPTTRSYRYGASKCSLSCLTNPLCTAATSLNDGSGTCLYLVSDAAANFSGYQSPATTAATYLKFCGTASSFSPPPPPPPPLPRSSTSSGRSVVIAAVAAALVTLAAVLALQAALCAVCRRRYGSLGSLFSSAVAQYAMLEYASGTPVQVSYRELKRATGGFKEKLGDGGFGSVYKGELPTADGGVTEVAVKRLEGLQLTPAAERQFRTEVAIIGSTHHMNLVRLCGFCAEGKNRVLVYEFMKNGSLDRYLFGGGGGGGGEALPASLRPDLDWELRYSILLGAARGLTYLHQECRDCIIHCDIKPENILLDDYFTAKLSDFGLAKLLSPVARGGDGGGAAAEAAAAATTLMVRGTRGYMAPEWRSNLPITVKSDVYAFGMVVLETVSGRRSFEAVAAEDGKQMSMTEWAYKAYFHGGRTRGVVDGRIMGSVDMEQMDRALKVAYWCMQIQPSSRPSMSKVVQMLDGAILAETPPIPISFAHLCPSQNISAALSSSSSFDRHQSAAHHQSLIARVHTRPTNPAHGLFSL